MLEAARRADISRLVQTSTSEVYGTPLALPIPETAPLNAQSPYAASKVGADQLALSYQLSFGLPGRDRTGRSIRSGREQVSGRIPTMINEALVDEFVLGSTAPTRDFLFVEDTFAGCCAARPTDRRAGDRPRHRGGNLDRGRCRPDPRRARAVQEADQVHRQNGCGRAHSEVQRLQADIGKAAEPPRLGRRRSRSSTAFRRTIEWLGDSLAVYKPSNIQRVARLVAGGDRTPEGQDAPADEGRSSGRPRLPGSGGSNTKSSEQPEVALLEQGDRPVVILLAADVEPEAVEGERSDRDLVRQEPLDEIREIEIAVLGDEVEDLRLQHIDAHADREVELRFLGEVDDCATSPGRVSVVSTP